MNKQFKCDIWIDADINVVFDGSSVNDIQHYQHITYIYRVFCNFEHYIMYTEMYDSGDYSVDDIDNGASAEEELFSGIKIKNDYIYQFNSNSWELAFEPIQEAYRSWVTEQALLVHRKPKKKTKKKK